MMRQMRSMRRRTNKMSKINRSMYPDLDSAQHRIDELDATIVQYKEREMEFLARLERINDIAEGTE